ncbi:MAG TPA: FHA domain-containing protein [Anaerolineae bacterium]|nr:FHA domain-containing protein [Anaerolineae bacterium]
MQAAPLLKLTMQQGPRPDQTFELHKDVYTLGREAGNDIIINDPQISRHHARLTLQGGSYVLEDLGSTNGSFVNGRRITGPTALSPGDMVGLGDTVVLSVSGAMDAAATQVSRVPQTAPSMQAARPSAPTPSRPPPVAQVGVSQNTQRMFVIGCAALTLVVIICMMALVAWSFLDCPSFEAFWEGLPILGSIQVSC